ncbi:hypothetical protein DPMN_175310 [Dreissena polymorpha]|uniref:Uncharacterized protein n=1 Tax=Dreissena polymorpha TaxID=45954 RepID=A0A9D4E7X6_DREPO|nr:hypothetical protein DPMN_175310 [Dreissena polymorpha]
MDTRYRRDTIKRDVCTHQTNKEDRDRFCDSLKIDINHLEPEQQEQLKSMLFEMRDVFSSGPLDLGNTDLVRHKIRLCDKQPRTSWTHK